MFDLFPQYHVKSELKAINISLQSTSETSINQQVQLVSDVQHEKEDLSVFFGIGMIVNIVMITSFFIWAVKQWKKNDKTKK